VNALQVTAVALGSALGIGAVLIAAPLLWPRSASAVQRAGVFGITRELLNRAGFERVPVGGFVVVSALVGFAAAATVQATAAVAALSLAAFCVGAAAPWLVARRRALARQAAGQAAWPDAVDQLVSAVRSGLALPEAVAALAHVGPDATRAAFAAFERDYRANGSFTACADRLKARLADPVADRILETLKMAREVGGTELIGVLKALATGLRADQALRSEVLGRQSWTVNAARLGVAAPWIVLVLLSTRPEAQSAYNSPGGNLVIVVGLAASVVAYRVMLALGRLPRERRWFR
jgi:tight adherence protein B